MPAPRADPGREQAAAVLFLGVERRDSRPALKCVEGNGFRWFPIPHDAAATHIVQMPLELSEYRREKFSTDVGTDGVTVGVTPYQHEPHLIHRHGGVGVSLRSRSITKVDAHRG